MIALTALGGLVGFAAAASGMALESHPQRLDFFDPLRALIQFTGMTMNDHSRVSAIKGSAKETKRMNEHGSSEHECFLAETTNALATGPPDILFVLADDLGYNEMGFMNETRGLHTPNLDRIASGGVVLKNYYVQPICSPTRSALMTGRYMRLGTQSNVIYWDTPWGVPINETYIPQNLKDAGYITA
eukprot:gene57361-biopygen73552